MGLGILESKTPGHVPGTVILDQEAAHSQAITSRLKHGRGKDEQIVLVPQPSDDPNDPLNWTSFQKNLVYFIFCLGTIVHLASAGPMLNASTVQLATDLQVPITDVVKLTGYILIAAGVSGPFVSALARKYGKRPLLLFSSMAGTTGCIIGQCAQNYRTLAVARIVEGLAFAGYEGLVLTCIGDLFFVHERGPRMAVIFFAMNAIANGIGIIAGAITTNLGWHYNFHILIPFSALQTILAFLFMPETSFLRSEIYNLDTTGSQENLEKLGATEERVQACKETVEAAEVEWSIPDTSYATPARKTVFQRMAIYNGTFASDSSLKMLLGCAVILLNAGGAWSIFTVGISITWYGMVGLVNSVLLASPPYLYSSEQVGYASSGPMIGSLLASVFMGIISDPALRLLTRRNRGVFEPEFQLPLTLFGAVCAVSGLVSMGYSIQQKHGIYLICFLWGLMSFGMTIITITCSNYALSAFREYSTEIFIMSSVFRNLYGYGVSNFIIDWLTTDGVTNVFNVMAGSLFALCLLSIPLYVFGKKYRQYWYHHNLIKIMHLETDKTAISG